MNTLYKQESNKINIKPIFKEPNDMPILEDLYNILGKNKRTKKIANKINTICKRFY